MHMYFLNKIFFLDKDFRYIVVSSSFSFTLLPMIYIFISKNFSFESISFYKIHMHADILVYKIFV